MQLLAYGIIFRTFVILELKVPKSASAFGSGNRKTERTQARIQPPLEPIALRTRLGGANLRRHF